MSYVEDAERTRTFEEILRRRYSCRAFAGQVLSQETMERLLALAQQAPSWCNVQPWHVYVLSGQAVPDLSGLLLASSDFDPRSTTSIPSRNTRESTKNGGALRVQRFTRAWA